MVHDALAELELAVLLVLEEVALLLGVLVQPEVGEICIDIHVIIALGEFALWHCGVARGNKNNNRVKIDG